MIVGVWVGVKVSDGGSVGVRVATGFAVGIGVNIGRWVALSPTTAGVARNAVGAAD